MMIQGATSSSPTPVSSLFERLPDAIAITGVPSSTTPQLMSMSSAMWRYISELVASFIDGTGLHPNTDPRPVVKQMMLQPPAANYIGWGPWMRSTAGGSVSSWTVVWSMPKRACMTAWSVSSSRSLSRTSSTTAWALIASRPDVSVHTCRSCTRRTPGTRRIASSISPRSRCAGVPSRRTLTACRRRRQVRGTMTSAIAPLPSGSASVQPVIVPRTWRLLRQAVNVLLEGTPAHLDLGEIEDAMRRVPGVRRVHDLHVWTLTSGREAMSAHAVVDDVRDSERLLETLHAVMHARFGIDHTTVQLETEPPAGLRIQGPHPI